MASRDSLETRKLLARGTVVYHYTDTPVAIRMRYLGTGTVTSVATINATSVTTITTEGTKAYAFATYVTIGAVVDKINGDGVFEARAIDVLRSAASAGALLAETLTVATYDENGNAVYDVKSDTSLSFFIGACLSNNRAFGSIIDGHRVSLQEINYVANMGTAAGDQLKVTARNVKTGYEYVVYAGLSVDTTATTVNFASGNGMITTKDGEELIVSITDAASMADGAYMRLAGILE